MPDDIKVGLALSGGGYRAMLYSLGSLWRLNELGWLRNIDNHEFRVVIDIENIG